MSPALLLLAAIPSAPPAPVTDLKLPPGFTARLYADNAVAPDVYTMTIDDAGRVLVAGRGYVRVLVDDDGDGYADRAVDLIDGLKDGPMGLLAEGDSLYVVADGGLKRYRGYNGKDKLKGPPETLVALKTGGEHDAHAVRRGPDGWLYLLCGNGAGVRKETITGDRSPVKEPIAGALLRISPDLASGGRKPPGIEVVADGFRNPYSFDFNLAGEPFTYDSDNERCVGLPWYEGCRFYHIVPGGNYGWRSPQLSQTWRKPPYFPDVVPPICDTGRGSPTGVACYRHTAFPECYRDGFFLADWTFGRIYHVPVTPDGSSYAGKHEVFAEATGTSGFAPTALAIHPKTGELFVSIGGRGTRGGVYRITHDKADANPKPLPMAKRSLDFDAERAKEGLSDCLSDNAAKRRRALELIARWWDKVPWGPKLSDAVKPNLSNDDRLIRRASGRIGKLWFVDLGKVTDQQAKLTLALEQVTEEPDWALKTAAAILKDADASVTLKLQATRIVQLAFGDLTAKEAVGTAWEGYTVRNTAKRVPTAELLNVLRVTLRLDDRNLEREASRTLAALSGDAIWSLLTHWTPETKAVDDIHTLASVAHLRGEWTETRARVVATALLSLHAKSVRDGDTQDRHWPIRVAEIAQTLGQVAPDLAPVILEAPKFGRPEDILFVQPLNLDRKVAARKFLTAAEKDKNYAWTPAVVELLAVLPPKETAKLLRELWDRPGLEDTVTRLLAVQPDAIDRVKFVVGLKSLDPDLVGISARALTLLAPDAKGEVYVQSVKALRRFPDEKPNAAVRTELVALLQKYSGEKIGADAKAWSAWAVKHDPTTEKPLNASDGFDAPAWGNRLAGVEWAKGDAARGRVAFTKATCVACHDGGSAVGPSLLGIAKRFGRDDLLTAILQPSKDVPPRYRPTRVVTIDDKAYTGIIVYEATDSVILQTGADTTVRIAGADIASKKPVEVSLMPAGLIDKLSDAEIADLLTYLATLGDPKMK